MEIKIYAEKMVAHAHKYGHSDARIISIDANSVVVHAGKVDEWHPCGSNERYTKKDIKGMITECPEIFE